MNAQGRATTRHAGDDLDRTAFQAIGCAGAKGYRKARLEGYQPATSEHLLLVHILAILTSGIDRGASARDSCSCSQDLGQLRLQR